MRLSLTRASAFASLLAVAVMAAPAAAQHQHGAKPDSAKPEKPAMKHDMGGMKHDMAGMKHEMGGKDHMATAWKEMDAFHAVLAGTFHPAADKGDFAPLKANAQALADKARAWAGSTAPATCATDEHKKTVESIATSAADLATKVKGGAPDADLKAAITAIHDRFETVEHACGGMNGMKGMKH
ncbi:MAG TPA: hypothetical protein VFV33_19050 [Gemmatimonadaceae bacterium]|nr:hypothetical protein [Gemmatimonadaceae bacterium]